MCVTQVGAKRVGVKLQPGITASDLIEPEDDVLAQLDYLGPQLTQRGLAYTCLSSLNGEPYCSMFGEYSTWAPKGGWQRVIPVPS